MRVRLLYYFISYFSLSFILSVGLVYFARIFSYRIGALDAGSDRAIHKHAVPRLGGIGIFLSLLLPMIISLSAGEWDDFHSKMTVILSGAVLVFAIGIYDDIYNVRIRYKLAFEVIAAIFIYLFGIRISGLSNPFGGYINLGWIGLPVTVLWIVVITNAVNLIDGIDGLAAGTCIFISIVLFLLADSMEIHYRVIYIIIIGGLCGFLLYNFPPASIFMGDSGSLSLGFCLAAISIVSSHKATAAATMMIPLLAFSLPVMDMIYAVIRRLYIGSPLSRADREHIHHKLLDTGMSKKKVVLTLYFIKIMILVVLFLIVKQQLNVDLIGVLLLFFLAAAGFRLLGYTEMLPTFREMRAGFEMNRNIRYAQYLIKKFVKGSSAEESSDDFRRQLNEIATQFNLDRVEVRIEQQAQDRLFFLFESGNRNRKVLIMKSPVYDGEVLKGEIIVEAGVDNPYSACLAEMMSAITKRIDRYV